jgi:hypothetical protein
MTKQKATIFIIFILLLSGCAHRQSNEDLIREQRQTSIDYMQLKNVGLENDYPIYSHSEFAKRNDVQGYIKFRNDQETQRDEAETIVYKRAIPSIATLVKACVLDSGHDGYYRKSADTCFDQLPWETRRPLVYKKIGVIPEYRKKEVIDSISGDLKVIFAREQAKAQKVRNAEIDAADRRDAAEQKAAAKRAYENSIQSLVE